MNKVLVFGHKNPDLDSVCSAIVMSKLENKLGRDVEPVILGKVNKETEFVLNYLNLQAPRIIDNVENDAEVILVDHNEFSQSVDNIENAKIVSVIDHHRICDFKTSTPIYYRAEPIGCTASILYKRFKEENIQIEKEEAILMVSAIISDTLLFKSPTCTPEDKCIASELAKISNIDVEKYGLQLLKAGTDLSDLSEKELISLDAKEVKLKDLKALIAQVNTIDIDEIMVRREKIEEEMKKMIIEKSLDIFVLAITDILNCNSKLISLGNSANLVEKAYNVKLENNSCLVEGVVSRKKQIIPILTDNA